MFTGSVFGLLARGSSSGPQTLVPSLFTESNTFYSPSVGQNTHWNPSDKSGTVTLSNGNLTAQGGSSSDQGVRAVAHKSSGKYYVEFTYTTHGTGGDDGVGICTVGESLSGMGSAANACLAFGNFLSGAIYYNGSNTGDAIGAITNGDVVCMALDMGNHTIWFRKNGGNWNGSPSANPATNTGGISVSTVFSVNDAYPVAVFNDSTAVVVANFGDSAYSFTAPSGFGGWAA